MGKIVAPPFKKRLGTVFLGEIDFPIFYGRFETLDYVDRVVMQDILLACAAVTHNKSGIQYDYAVKIVKSALQIEWYKHREKEVPAILATNLAGLIVEATTQKIESPAGGGKRSGLKIKDIIIDGLLRNLPEADIIQTVHSQFPEARTGPRDLAYYRHVLRKSGDLPPPEPRQKTSRKETTMAKTKDAEETQESKPRKVRTIDILNRAKEEGLETSEVARLLNEALDGRAAEDLTIKDVIIPGILNGLDTDAIVEKVHSTFADVPSVTPKTGAKDVAYYRTRLRKDYNLEIPSTRSATKKSAAVEEVVAEDNDDVADEKPARQGRRPRAKKASDDDGEE